MKASRPRHRAALSLGCALTLFSMALGAVTVTSDGKAKAALTDAADGDVFRLQAMLPDLRHSDLATLARARLAAARLDANEARRLVDAYLAAAKRSPAERALAWPIAADASFAAGDYGHAASAAHAWLQALVDGGASEDERADALQMATLADQLATAPPQHLDVYTPTAESITRDKVGLPRSHAVINGMAQEVVVDTGANLSVVSVSTAKKLGLRMLDGSSSVGSASQQAVTSRIGVADQLRFGGLQLSHVPFLVLDDASLNMPVPGGYQIDAILGFPVLRQLQRLTFTRDGKLEPSRAEGTKVDEGSNLRMAGSDLYVDVRINDVPVSMHLDTGGASSSLSFRFAHDHPAMVKGLALHKDHVAGAGGARVRASVALKDVRVRIGDREATLPELTASMSDAGNVKEPNVLGGDILRLFDRWTIDFPRMSFEPGQPLAAKDEPLHSP